MASLFQGIGPGWRRALVVLAVVWMALLWLHRDTGLAMVTIWDERDSYAHAWMVPPIALWLVWRLRRQVLAIDPQPAPWFLLPIAAISLVWLAGEAVAVATATQFALVAMLVLAVPAVLGWRVGWVLLFPLGFLFFCVPFGEFLSPTLMHWTADITVAALRLSGIPVFQEALMFVIPSGRWSVIEACSGIRYLIASVMVGALFAYLNYTSWQRRLLFVGVSIAVPLLANWLRAYMIVMLGHLSSNQLAVGADHLVYGWVLFGIIIVTLYWIGARWAQTPADEPALAPSTGRWPLLPGTGVAVVALAAMAAPLWLWQRLDASTSAAPVSLSLPADLPQGWRPVDDPAPRWEPGFLNPAAQARAAYRAADGATVGVYVGYYRRQGLHSKVVSSANHLVIHARQDWAQMAEAQRSVALPAGALPVREGLLLQAEAPGAGRQQLRVWQTYWIDGAFVTGNIAGKLLGAWGRLSGRGDDGAVLLVFADDTDPAAAQASLARFLAQTLPALTVAIDAPRRDRVGLVPLRESADLAPRRVLAQD